MTRPQRIIGFLISLSGLVLIALLFRKEALDPGIPGVVLFSALLMLSFSSLFLEHFFTTPSDVLASSLAIMLLLAPTHAELSNLGVWYYIFFGYVFLGFLLALIALLLWQEQAATSSRRNRVSNSLKGIAVIVGKGKLLFGALAFMSLLFYVDSQSPFFIAIGAYAILILVVDPKNIVLKGVSLSRETTSDVGEIIGVQSRNTFLARLYREHVAVRRFDLVEFKYSMDDTERVMTGMITDNYLLNEQQWVKILSSSEVRQRIPAQLSGTHKANVVYKIQKAEEVTPLDSFVGVVVEDSNINRVRFEYAARVPVAEGDLLELYLGKDIVLYQVVQGVTEVEKLESRNEAGLIIGEAAQLGTWDTERLTFDKFGWVPEVNTPLFVASDIDLPKVAQDEVMIGRIPGTNYPAVLNVREAVAHHLAVLGVTGSGKSVFTRELIRKIIKQGVKVICVDFTNEYRPRFSDLKIESVIPEGKEELLFSCINSLERELAEFRNKQDTAKIKTLRSTLQEVMSQCIQQWFDSKQPVCLFELPDVENTTGILDYTRWFFKALFTLARAGKFGGQNICVILEEAHTVIPEWNFIGIEEKTAQALVNAIGQIALQGRKYQIGFIVVAQRTANVSKTVLTQCNSVIAFQQFDKTSCDFLSNYMNEQMIRALPTLHFRQAIAVGRAFRAGVPLIFEVPEIKEN